LHGDVIHAVVYEIGGNAGVQAKLCCERKLVSDGVGGGDENRVREARGIEREETCKAADLRENIFIEGASSEALDFVVGLGGTSVCRRRRWCVVERPLTRSLLIGRLLQEALPFSCREIAV